MKILMVAPHASWPQTTAGRIRLWEELNFFAARHEVTLVSFAETEQEWAGKRELERICCRVIYCPFPDQPAAPDAALRRLVPDALGAPEMQNALEQLRTHRFDVVLLETLGLARYRELLSCPTVLTEYDIVSQLFRQYADHWLTRRDDGEHARSYAYWRAMALRMYEYENRTWGLFPLRAAVSAADQAEMERRCVQGKSIVVENGVNPVSHPLLPLDEGRTILFPGAMNYPPNAEAAVHLARTIMPLVWRVAPDTRLCIAGKEPGAPILALRTDPRIEILPNPVDMQQVAARATVVAVPLHLGSGTRMKILEALAWGVPVISTTHGCEGLDVADGETILIRDEPQAFADGILELLADPAQRVRLRRAGRQLVETRYDWQQIFSKFEDALQELVNEPSTS